MKKKSANVAAILNFLIPGIGYIYAKKREGFGWLVLVSMILFAIYSYNKPELFGETILVASSLVLSFAFAFDIHKELSKKKH